MAILAQGRCSRSPRGVFPRRASIVHGSDNENDKNYQYTQDLGVASLRRTHPTTHHHVTKPISRRCQPTAGQVLVGAIMPHLLAEDDLVRIEQSHRSLVKP
jgi:hypothetical protein